MTAISHMILRLGFKMFCQRGSEFLLLALCVCVWGGGGQVQLLSFREKITEDLRYFLFTHDFDSNR